MAITNETMERFRKMEEENILDQMKKQYAMNTAVPTEFDKYNEALIASSPEGKVEDPDWILKAKMYGDKFKSGVEKVGANLEGLRSKLAGLFSGGM